MKKIMVSLLAILIAAANTFSQDNDYIKRPTLAIHFLLNDFKGAAAVRNSTFSTALRDKKFKVKDMSPGMAINYIRGISNHLDFSTTLAGSFLDYPIDGRTAFGNEYLLLEADAMIHAKMLSDKYWVVPYLSGGIGASKYKGYFGAFLPVGMGLQVSLFDEAFMMVNSQYRMKISDNANYHFYHSIGFAGNIGGERKQKIIPPPPPPVVEAPKDSDGDGIVDIEDKCPAVAGVAKYEGCPVPDTDKDGINDDDDKCVSVAGVARYQGCPIPDTDKDGVNDEEDKCKEEAGLARYQGCPIPDSDKDGINDEEDKCPNIPGVAANSGCPVINEAIVKKVNFAAKNLFFATGSYKLLAKSNKSLNDVAKIMSEYADLKLDIDGHTDNTGKADKNQQLSQQRADAVKAYLVKKGVDESRLNATGYGQDKPVVDNKTAAGKSKNRRVEMKLKYY